MRRASRPAERSRDGNERDEMAWTGDRMREARWKVGIGVGKVGGGGGDMCKE